MEIILVTIVGRNSDENCTKGNVSAHLNKAWTVKVVAARLLVCIALCFVKKLAQL